MSKCFGCYFHEGGFMTNRCDYFEAEYYSEPDRCLAFTVDGNLSKETKARIFDETDGVFGEPEGFWQEIEVRNRIYGEK